MSDQKRHQRGAPASQGGKYAPHERAGGTVELDPIEHRVSIATNLSAVLEDARGTILIGHPFAEPTAVRSAVLDEDGDVILSGFADVNDEYYSLTAGELLDVVDQAADAALVSGDRAPRVMVWTPAGELVELNTASTSPADQATLSSVPDAQDPEHAWLLQHLADGGYTESTQHPDGSPKETKYYDGEDHHIRTRTFEAERAGDGTQLPAGDAYYQEGKLHNPGPSTPALRTWEGGEPRVTVWMERGQQQDPEPGVPAFLAQAERGEQIRGHYQRGVLQDPEPGVPAHVATIDGGKMKRSTFATMGTVTKQVDEVQLPSVGGAPNLVATTTRTAG